MRRKKDNFNIEIQLSFSKRRNRIEVIVKSLELRIKKPIEDIQMELYYSSHKSMKLQKLFSVLSIKTE